MSARGEGDNAVNTQQLPDSSFIYDTSIVDLSGADAYYDNQTVQVTGEVIGDSIRAGVSGEASVDHALRLRERFCARSRCI